MSVKNSTKVHYFLPHSEHEILVEKISNIEDPNGYIEWDWLIVFTLHLGETLACIIYPRGMPGTCKVGGKDTLAIIPCHDPNKIDSSSIRSSVNVLWWVAVDLQKPFRDAWANSRSRSPYQTLQWFPNPSALASVFRHGRHGNASIGLLTHGFSRLVHRFHSYMDPNGVKP